MRTMLIKSYNNLPKKCVSVACGFLSCCRDIQSRKGVIAKASARLGCVRVQYKREKIHKAERRVIALNLAHHEFHRECIFQPNLIAYIILLCPHEIINKSYKIRSKNELSQQN